VEAGEQTVVGVNAYQSNEKTPLELLKVDPAIEQAQRDKLAQLRTRRDNTRVAELLGQLEAAARGDDNLMPVFIACVEGDVTLGEICRVLRGVFGEYQPNVII
jgi:methylmalonyl-CoA mutase N-terminal domain/subunit